MMENEDFTEFISEGSIMGVDNYLEYADLKKCEDKSYMMDVTFKAYSVPHHDEYYIKSIFTSRDQSATLDAIYVNEITLMGLRSNYS